jgi:hypothetical protein
MEEEVAEEPYIYIPRRRERHAKKCENENAQKRLLRPWWY